MKALQLRLLSCLFALLVNTCFSLWNTYAWHWVYKVYIFLFFILFFLSMIVLGHLYLLSVQYATWSKVILQAFYYTQVKDNLITPCTQVRLQTIVAFLYIGDVISHGDGRTQMLISMYPRSPPLCALKGYVLLYLCAALVIIMNFNWNVSVWPICNLYLTVLYARLVGFIILVVSWIYVKYKNKLHLT